jgi:hypothetical protein
VSICDQWSRRRTLTRRDDEVVEYTDDEYASIESRSLGGVYGYDRRGTYLQRKGNGFIILGAFGALVFPIFVGIPLIIAAFWRVAKHHYHAWLGVGIALASVAIGSVMAFTHQWGQPF